MAANNIPTSIRHQQHHNQESASLASPIMSLQGGNGASSSGGGGGGAVIYYGKGSSAGIFDTSLASFPKYQPNLHGMPLDWTPEELVILDEGLIRYASESNLAQYAKIAMHLDNKTIRDVALRCRWKRDFSKRRKEDFSLARKSKDRKEKNLDPSPMSSHVGMSSIYPPYSQGLVSNVKDDGFSYSGTSSGTWQQLQQNVQAFEQISSNLVTNQLHENIGLLCRARENILQILQNLNEPLTSGKRMPLLPVKVNDDLANFILPPPSSIAR